MLSQPSVPFREHRVVEGSLQLPGFASHRAGTVGRVAWRIAGVPGAPVVAALGGISAHRRAYGGAAPPSGWWPLLAGPGLPLDTDRFRLLGIDWLTVPDGLTVDTRDQARALLEVCDHLGIDRLHAIAGASYGGMVALALAELAPERVRHVLAIGAAHRSDALSTAWRSIQREIVRQFLCLGDGAGGLRIARALAMTTYRTRAELNARFPAGAAESGASSFPVEDYVFARGADFARRVDPRAFLSLSNSIDRHCVDPARIRAPVTLVAVVEDQLVPVEDIRELAASLAGPCRLIELHSRYGHDAFLKECELLRPAFAAALEGEPS
ncbi:MAG TPA: homoserine O-succinyltransferase [Steroidobacteraceae bacterium]|nr:homoserine O-succinyltransferase [Steroidobacteraceae bacterium]